MRFFRNRKNHSNYKPLLNKTKGNEVRVAPQPPSRRPNIKERISMLEMAQLNHQGIYVPENGIRLVLPATRSRTRIFIRSTMSLRMGSAARMRNCFNMKW